MNLWGFLTIAVVCGVTLAMIFFYLEYRKSVKKMELEALKYKYQNGQDVPNQLSSRNDGLDSQIHIDDAKLAEKVSRY